MGGTTLVSLAEARETAREWSKIAKAGGDPKEARDSGKHDLMTFEQAARKVWSEQIETTARNAKHRAQWIRTLETYAFPTIGKLPISAVEQRHVLEILTPIWLTKPETARRVRQRLRAVFGWAKVAGKRTGANPVDEVEAGLKNQPRKGRSHFAALPWPELPDVLRRIEATDGMGALALRFAILTAARSGEVRGATWAEMDLDAGVWTIPADRMKSGREHRVPLNKAALAVLERVRGLSDGLLFPGAQRRKPLSDMTLGAVLRRLEIRVTVHGFRSSFRDWTEDQTAYPREVKEAALAHQVRDATEAAYRRTDLFEKRRGLMDEWDAFCGGSIG